MCPRELIKRQANQTRTQQVCKFCRSPSHWNLTFAVSLFTGNLSSPATSPNACGTITTGRTSRTGMFTFSVIIAIIIYYVPIRSSAINKPGSPWTG